MKCKKGFKSKKGKCVKSNSKKITNFPVSKVQTGEGIGFLSLLGLLFIGLKLGKVIDWTWWWVLAPIWIPMVLGLIFIIIFIIFLRNF